MNVNSRGRPKLGPEMRQNEILENVQNLVQRVYAIPGISEGGRQAKVENGKYRCKAFCFSLPGEGAGEAIFLKGRR